MKQVKRDVVGSELSLEYFAQRMSEGWKIASIEWVRETELEVQAESAPLLNVAATLPYGLRIRGDGVAEENPLEATVLLMILDQIVKEKRIQEIAAELNGRGYVTREGGAWTASEVFELLPRLIEVGPGLLKSGAWQQRRDRMKAGPGMTQ